MTAADSQRALIASSGQICFWQGASLWVGRGAGKSDWHAHHAHQVAISLDGICKFRSRPGDPWKVFAGAVVPSRCTHEFEFEGGIAHLFVEPETRQGRAIGHRFGPQGIGELPSAVHSRLSAPLRKAERNAIRGSDLVILGRHALALLTGSLPAAVAVDGRIAAVIAYVARHVREPVSLAGAASSVFLSPGRFRHLFVSETGTPFRSYLRWTRLQVALECAMRGQSWTSAAHEAGFADAAHLTRTFKRMFGINPSALANLVQEAGIAPGRRRARR